MEDRAAARGDGVDREHRCAQANAGDLRLEGALEIGELGPREVRDVGRGAAHVEADHLVEAGVEARAHHADDAARRPREDRVLALEAARAGEPAVRLHELHVHAPQLVRDPIDVAAQDWRQIGVDDGGVAARDELHQRRDQVRGADLREADLARDPRHGRLVRRVAVPVHQDDGEGADSAVVHALQRGARGAFVERREHVAARADALVDLDDLLVKKLGQHDVPVEDPRAALGCDAERVAKSARDRQRRGLALALQQRVRRHRRPHLHGLDQLAR